MGSDTKPTRDLDALLAIVRRRTPGEIRGEGKGDLCGISVHDGKTLGGTAFCSYMNERDCAAIVAVVNNFEAVAERCKRAEDLAALRDAEADCMQASSKLLQAEVAELTRQRDELLTACDLARKWLVNSIAVVVMNEPEPLPVLDAVLASVKGGADAKA